MGLLDSIASQAINAVAGSNHSSSDTPDIMGLLGTLLNHPDTGGISGLMAAFQSQGLSHIVSSWIGKGANLPISADQLQAVLGQGPLQAMAQQAGVSGQQMSATLSEQLPGLIDQLTPDGELPKQASLVQGLGMLKELLR